MNTFLQLPAERRRFAFQQVDEAMGLQAFSVEKDFWVCWTLRELFTLPGVGVMWLLGFTIEQKMKIFISSAPAPRARSAH
jgi:hypothetical protein